MKKELTPKQIEMIKDEMSKQGINIELNHENIDIHILLSKISIEEILNNIAEFRNLNFKKISDKELFDSLMKVLSVQTDTGSYSMLFPRFGTYPTGTRFYRVRKLSIDESTIPSKTISKEEDVWNPPVDCVKKLGRLNKSHESLLYTSPQSPYSAIQEMEIGDGDRFGLIVYEALEPIKVVLIGLWDNVPDLSDEENLKMRIYTEFLRTEFTREVGIGTEYLYRISESITKNYFDLPPRVVQDAWCYPSTKDKKSVNVCFRPDIAKELLHFIGVQYCKLKKKSDALQVQCKYIGSGFDENRRLIFHSIDSDVCKKLFPEFYDDARK